MADKTKVKLVTLGHLTLDVDVEKLRDWKSALFEIEFLRIPYVLPDPEGGKWEYPDEQILTLLEIYPDANLTLFVVNFALEGNYYARRFTGNRIVISFHEIKPMLKLENMTPEMYILFMIYRYLFVMKRYNNIPAMNFSVTHVETRGCILDHTPMKEEIIYALDKVSICSECKNEMQRQSGFVSQLEAELKRLKKPLFFRLSEFIQKHPIRSIIFAALAGIVINMASSLFYDMIRGIFDTKIAP